MRNWPASAARLPSERAAAPSPLPTSQVFTFVAVSGLCVSFYMVNPISKNTLTASGESGELPVV